MHRLFQQTNPCDEFIQWVNKNMPEISKYVDGKYLVESKRSFELLLRPFQHIKHQVLIEFAHKDHSI